MIHELKEIINQAFTNQQKGLKNVLATVVHLEGSSYRKPGVRMLISEDEKMTGAVSGGCVEKEILHRSKSVFNNEEAKIITYDGRYKLGCEGVLYILIEPFFISELFHTTFRNAILNRKLINIVAVYSKNEEASVDFGSTLTIQNLDPFTFSKNVVRKPNKNLLSFQQKIKPAFNLLIIGAEHDAVKLCKMGSLLGWQIDLITSLKDPKSIDDFPGANSVVGSDAEIIDFSKIDTNTGIVIMNHSYVQDLKYVIALAKQQPRYIGILGTPSRRERLFNELFEYEPDTTEAFLDSIYTPAGLHIGAQTPEEIGVSIIAEILAVIRAKEPFSLRKLEGKIHK